MAPIVLLVARGPCHYSFESGQLVSGYQVMVFLLIIGSWKARVWLNNVPIIMRPVLPC